MNSDQQFDLQEFLVLGEIQSSPYWVNEDQQSSLDGGKIFQTTQPLLQGQNSSFSYEQQSDQNDQQIFEIQDIIDKPDQHPPQQGQQIEQPTQPIKKTKPAKNLPILLAKHINKFVAKFLRNTNRQTKAKNQLRYFLHKDENKSQKSYGIKDIRRLCRFYGYNKRIVYQYLKNHFYVDLLLSAKVENPTDYIDHIDWYLRMVKKPRLMRTNLRQ